MKRIAIVFAFAMTFCSVAALAKTFPVPAEDPIATVTIPDSWEPSTYDGGVEATSADQSTYIAMEEVEAADVTKAVTEGLKYYIKQGVAIDADSKKLTDTKINNLDAFDVTFKGKTKDGDTIVGLTLVQTNAQNKFLMLYYWGTPEGEKANVSDLKAISDSIQATK